MTDRSMNGANDAPAQSRDRSRSDQVGGRGLIEDGGQDGRQINGLASNAGYVRRAILQRIRKDSGEPERGGKCIQNDRRKDKRPGDEALAGFVFTRLLLLPIATIKLDLADWTAAISIVAEWCPVLRFRVPSGIKRSSDE